MRALLLPLPWVGTVVTATSFDIALLTARSHKPRIAVLDILTLGAQGLAACRLLHEATPWTRIALMAAEGAMPRPLATKYGVSGFLSKSTRAETLCQQIYRVGNGEQAFQCNGSQPSMNKLTERERNVLENLSRGCTNRELAQKMQLSENTVKQHVSAVYRKLEVRNRAEATSRALELGLVY
jgi:DNA-binding NarL/FixJ family response regulator